ncbi:hypothetical protein OG21DRAFT_1380787, partial [Imleria badia]
VKHLISSSVPNSVYISLMSKTTSHEYYEALQECFKDRSLVVSVERRCQLGEMKLKENGDARAHLDKMSLLREELTAMNNPVTDNDFFNMATSTLPYATLARVSITKLYDSGASQHLSPCQDQLINFKTIPPKPITAADNWTFDTIGYGDLPI